MELSALRHLHPILEENTADTTPGMTWKQTVYVLGGGTLLGSHGCQHLRSTQNWGRETEPISPIPAQRDRGVQPMLPGLTRVGQGTHKATPMGNALWVEVQSLGTQSGSRALGTVH